MHVEPDGVSSVVYVGVCTAVCSPFSQQARFDLEALRLSPGRSDDGEGCFVIRGTRYVYYSAAHPGFPFRDDFLDPI